MSRLKVFAQYVKKLATLVPLSSVAAHVVASGAAPPTARQRLPFAVLFALGAPYCLLLIWAMTSDASEMLTAYDWAGIGLAAALSILAAVCLYLFGRENHVWSLRIFWLCAAVAFVYWGWYQSPDVRFQRNLVAAVSSQTRADNFRETASEHPNEVDRVRWPRTRS